MNCGQLINFTKIDEKAKKTIKFKKFHPLKHKFADFYDFYAKFLTFMPNGHHFIL